MGMDGLERDIDIAIQTAATREQSCRGDAHQARSGRWDMRFPGKGTPHAAVPPLTDGEATPRRQSSAVALGFPARRR